MRTHGLYMDPTFFLSCRVRAYVGSILHVSNYHFVGECVFPCQSFSASSRSILGVLDMVWGLGYTDLVSRVSLI